MISISASVSEIPENVSLLTTASITVDKLLQEIVVTWSVFLLSVESIESPWLGITLVLGVEVWVSSPLVELSSVL